jgi:hypothetical protein
MSQVARALRLGRLGMLRWHFLSYIVKITPVVMFTKYRGFVV